jgi:hypothetical protein
MARRSTPSPPQPPILSPAEKRHGIGRLRRRIAELQAFDPLSVQGRRAPEIVRLEAAIDETLTAIFGRNTDRYNLYSSATDLEPAPVLSITPSWIAARGGGMQNRENIHELPTQIGERKKHAIVLLEQAIQGLEEEFIPEPEPSPPAQVADHQATSNSTTPAITEAHIRGRLLAIFHDRRHNADGWVPTSAINMSPDVVSSQVIGGVCQQLADVGLIRWNASRSGSDGGFIFGTAKITGKGVAAFEAGESADIDIRFPSKNAPAATSPSTPDDAPLTDAARTEIRKVISTVMAELPALTLSNSAKADITADINQIEVEIERPSPRRKFLKTFLESLRDNLAKAMATGLVALVAGLIAKYFHLF